MQIDQSTIEILLGIAALISIIFTVFNYFRNPQIKTDQATTKLQDEIAQLKKDIIEIKETHLRGVDNDIKSLTFSVNDLAKSVVELRTIINERIPKRSPSLTPPGA